MRLDSYLVESGFIRSRERAKEHIKNGEVLINGKAVLKPSFDVNGDEKIEFTGEKLRYVGRGGLKLEKAIESFGIDLSGKVCIDIGASTGGFTDCMLQNGAVKVYAVDVGHDQLDTKLVSDNRVVNMERTNINDISVENLDPVPNFVSADVSFVSLKNIFAGIGRLLDAGAEAVLLIKPQFEAGKSAIGKNGIVKDRKVHITVLNDIIAFISSNGFAVNAVTFSPISGGDGNIEYLAYVSKNNNLFSDVNVRQIVEEGFGVLKK